MAKCNVSNQPGKTHRHQPFTKRQQRAKWSGGKQASKAEAQAMHENRKKKAMLLGKFNADSYDMEDVEDIDSESYDSE